MNLSEDLRAGFALAALLLGDRDLRGVRAALPPGAAAVVASLLEPREESRKAHVAALLERVRPQLRALPPGLPPRAGCLLATRLPRPVGRALLAEAPPPRPELTIDAGLTPRLLRIARRLAHGAGSC